MGSEDDPEARIRDLERSISDEATRSELGTGSASGGYGYVPPGAGSSYPPPPQFVKKSGFRIGWVLVVVIVAVFLMPLAGVIYGVYSTISSVRDATPDVDTRTSAATTEPMLTPTSPTHRSLSRPTSAATTTTTTSARSTASAGGGINYMGFGARDTLVCDGGSVNVSGQDNTITITGHCSEVHVSGRKSRIVVDSADTITAEGSHNEVTYHSGTPNIEADGTNVVKQG